MMLLKQCLALAIVAWLPGAVIFRLPWLDRDRRAALDAEERLFWAIVLSVVVSLSIVLTLAALHRYSFERLLMADAAVAAGAALLTRGRLRLGPAARAPGLTAIIPVALMLLGLWRFFPSSEYVIGGKDPGTYVNEGIQIAQRGALVIRDPVVASVPPFARDLFFPSHQRQDYYGTRFMGFFVKDPDRGAVIGQFPHLFPASIAIGYGVDGLTGALRTVGAWALLGLLAFYFAGARLVGRTAAAAAAGLLALHVIEVWFSRYPNAEVVMQALLFAALLANARAHVDGNRFFAPVAGVLLGLLLFLRFDAVLGVAGVGAGVALSAFNGQRPKASFLAVFTAVGALAVLYLLGPMRAYADLPIVFISHLPSWQYAVLGLTAAGAIAGLLVAARYPAFNVHIVRWTPGMLTVVLSALALYALFLRQPAGRLAAHDAYALRTFTNFYLTLPALLAALIGLWLVARRAFWRDPALFATIAVFSCFFFFKIRIVTDHFWMTRRFLPVILPGALLFASAAALSGTRGGWMGARATRTLIGVAFAGLLAVRYGQASAPLLHHVEYAGLIPRLEQLAAGIKDDDLVIAESRDAAGDVHVLALPLAYIYARQVLVLNSARPDKAMFAAFLDWARTRYGRVLFIGSGGTDLLSHRYGVEPLASERFQVPEYDAPFDAYPRFVRAKEFDYGIYAFTAPESHAGRGFDLDIGVRDDLHVLRFHAKEQADGRTMRWTRGTSYVSITTIDAAAREVTLWMNNGGRPPAAPAATVTVSLHGQLLGTVTVASGFAPYTLPIPADVAARAAAFGDPVELKLVTAVWNPHDVIGSPDDRDLGVMVDRVTVQ
jgi:hypothetical protein